MVEHQGPRRHAYCQIIIDQMQDVTSRLNPYLISVQVIDSIEHAHSECHLELDDRNAELQIPPDGVRIQVAMGWRGEGPRVINTGRRSESVQGSGVMEQRAYDLAEQAASTEMKFGGPGLELVFDGHVTSTESGFGRKGGGRRLWIEATSGDTKNKVKEQQHKTFGEGKQDDSSKGGGKKVTLKEVMTDVFGFAGLQVAMSPEMDKIARDFWHVNDSPQNFAQRMANENGGVLSIAGGVASLTGKGDGVNGAGVAMPTIEAIWGINLIGWRIKPYAGRAQYADTSSKFFEIHEGVWNAVQKGVSATSPFGGSEAVSHALNAVADKTQGEQKNQGQVASVEQNRSKGWILLNGEPRAKAKGTVIIDGARPGVDGSYQITEAEHNYTRGVGYTTRCNVRYPQPKIGGDRVGWEQKKSKAEQEAAARDARNKALDEEEEKANKGLMTEEEEFIKRRADAIAVPGRSPMDKYWGYWHNNEPSARDKKAAKAWYAKRNMPLPPEWGKYFDENGLLRPVDGDGKLIPPAYVPPDQR